jgi:hypothetical protein
MKHDDGLTKSIPPRFIHRVQLVDHTGRGLKLAFRVKVDSHGTATLVVEARELESVPVELAEVTP